MDMYGLRGIGRIQDHRGHVLTASLRYGMCQEMNEEEPEEEKITQQEIDDFFAELEETTKEEEERIARLANEEANRLENMSIEDFRKQASSQGITTMELIKRNLHNGLKNLSRDNRRMQIAYELKKQELMANPELAHDIDFMADMEYLEQELSRQKQSLQQWEEYT